MVAVHNGDLRAAGALGLRTAFVLRPTEHGPGQTSDLAPEGDYDAVASGFGELAERL
jgi:2-haloacid dehalogenase